MTMICTPQYLDRIAKENPELTVKEFLEQEMTLQDVKEFAQMERDRIDLEYDMTHQ